MLWKFVSVIFTPFLKIFKLHKNAGIKKMPFCLLHWQKFPSLSLVGGNNVRSAHIKVCIMKKVCKIRKIRNFTHLGASKSRQNIPP